MIKSDIINTESALEKLKELIGRIEYPDSGRIDFIKNEGNHTMINVNFYFCNTENQDD